MLIVLMVLMTVPSVISQIVLWSLLAFTYGVIIIYDSITSRRLNTECKEILFHDDISKLDAI